MRTLFGTTNTTSKPIQAHNLVLSSGFNGFPFGVIEVESDEEIISLMHDLYSKSDTVPYTCTHAQAQMEFYTQWLQDYVPIKVSKEKALQYVYRIKTWETTAGLQAQKPDNFRANGSCISASNGGTLTSHDEIYVLRGTGLPPFAEQEYHWLAFTGLHEGSAFYGNSPYSTCPRIATTFSTHSYTKKFQLMASINHQNWLNCGVKCPFYYAASIPNGSISTGEITLEAVAQDYYGNDVTYSRGINVGPDIKILAKNSTTKEYYLGVSLGISTGGQYLGLAYGTVASVTNYPVFIGKYRYFWLGSTPSKNSIGNNFDAIIDGLTIPGWSVNSYKETVPFNRPTGISGSVTSNPHEWWEYKNSKNQPVYDKYSGAQINPID